MESLVFRITLVALILECFDLHQLILTLLTLALFSSLICSFLASNSWFAAIREEI